MSPMKKLLLILIVLLIGFYSKGQTLPERELDSLKQVLWLEDVDPLNKYFTYQKIINHYGYGPYDSLWRYVDGAVTFSEETNDSKILYASSFMKARTFAYLEDFDSAKRWYSKSYNYASQGNNEKGMAILDLQMGGILMDQDSVLVAMDYLKRSEEAFEKLNVTNSLRSSYQVLGELMIKMQRYADALAYHKKTLGLSKNKVDSASSYHNFYGPLALLKNYDSAKYYLDKTSTMVEEGTFGHFSLLLNYSHFYLEEEHEGFDAAKAKSYLKLAEDNYLSTYANRSDSLTFHINSAFSHLLLGEIFEAKPHIESHKRLVDKSDGVVHKYKHLWVLSEYHLARGEYQSAYEYYFQYDTMKENFSNATIRNQLYILSKNYEVEKRDSKIQILNIENEKKELEAGFLLKQRNIFLISAAFLLMGGLVIVRQSVLRKRVNNLLVDKTKQLEVALLDREILLKEIHHRVKNNLQVISSLLNLQAGSLSDEAAIGAVKDGQYRVKSMALIHQKLYQDDDLKGVAVQDYIESLTSELMNTFGMSQDDLSIEVDTRQLKLDIDTLIPLGLIINELITNSMKYAFKQTEMGLLKIEMSEEDEKLAVSVCDNGAGMDQSALASNDSFGWKMIRSLARKLKAEIHITNKTGTEVKLIISRYKLAV